MKDAHRIRDKGKKTTKFVVWCVWIIMNVVEERHIPYPYALYHTQDIYFFRLFRVIKRKTTYNGLRCDAKHVKKNYPLGFEHFVWKNFVQIETARILWKYILFHKMKLKNYLPVSFFFLKLHVQCKLNWQLFASDYDFNNGFGWGRKKFKNKYFIIKLNYQF